MRKGGQFLVNLKLSVPGFFQKSQRGHGWSLNFYHLKEKEWTENHFNDFYSCSSNNLAGNFPKIYF